MLPQGFNKVDAFATNTSYEFEPKPGVVSNLFKQIEANKNEWGIDDWGLSQTSLEEVFLRIINDADAEADK